MTEANFIIYINSLFKEPKVALAIAEEECQKNPSEKRSIRWKFRALMELKDYKNAELLLIENSWMNPLFFMDSWIDLYEAMGEYNQAINKATQLINILPSGINYHRRAMLYRKINDDKNAEHDLLLCEILMPGVFKTK